MFLFIAIVFIAELIIAVTLLAYILKADKAVLNLQKEVIPIKSQIKGAFDYLKASIEKANNQKTVFWAILRQKRNQCLWRIGKVVLFYLLIHFFKCKCQKARTICNGILIAKDIWDEISV